MTRKDFILVAQALAAARQYSGRAPDAASFIHGIDAAAFELAGRLPDSNPLFDRERFLTACGCEVL